MALSASKPARNEPERRTRLPAGDRRAALMRAAAGHFAAHGFDALTRDLAAAMGMTQALIYRHFRSKDALIEATLGGVRQGPWLNAAAPLAVALADFYKTFAANAAETRMRLFMRAGLDGRSWPTKRGSALTRNLFLPAIAALRRAAGMPGLDAAPPIRGERELVMMLHASMVFLGIRRHVYQMPMPEKLDDVVDLYFNAFMRGIGETVRALHEDGEESLKVTLLADLRDRVEAISPDLKRSSSK